MRRSFRRVAFSLGLLMSTLLMTQCALADNPAATQPTMTIRQFPSQPGCVNRMPINFEKGVNLLIYGNDPNFRSKANRLLSWLPGGMGANSIEVVIPAYMDSPFDNKVYLDTSKQSPTDQNLSYLLKQSACAYGFHTGLRMVLDEGSISDPKWGKDSNGNLYWRGSIQPSNRALWFQSYEQVLLKYAAMAQDAGVDTLSLGSEFKSLENENDLWSKLISDLHGTFHGDITYSINWDTLKMHYPWWDNLDYRSIDPYYNLNVSDDASQAQINDAWKDVIANRLTADLGGVDPKNVSLAEVGIYPKVGELKQPWDHGDNQIPNPAGLETQRRYFQAVCTQVVRTQAVRGVYFWLIGFDPPPPNSPGNFNFRGSPAEQEVKNCFTSV